jgi:hypothetical protein
LKKLLFIFTLFINFSLNAQIEGTFKHNICKIGPNCFVYQFFKDGTFKYIYHQDILGSGELTGKYLKTKDTLKLTTDKFIFSKESKLLEQEYTEKDSTKIAVKLQRATEKGKEDTQFWEWYISINGGKYLKTNSNGVLIIPRIKIEKIEIKDILEIELPETVPFKLVDSVFYTTSEKNSYEIYAAEDGTEIDLGITAWMTKMFILKGKKLFPITFEPEETYLGKKKTFYERE